MQTSRYASKITDDKGIDLVGTDPLAVQCKVVSTKSVRAMEFIEHMQLEEEQIPIVVVKQREKRKSKFYTKTKLAILRYDDFLQLIEKVFAENKRAGK